MQDIYTENISEKNIAYLYDLGLGKEDKKVITIKDKILINDH